MSFKTWIVSGIDTVKIENKIIMIYAKDEFTLNILKARYLDIINTAVHELDDTYVVELIKQE